MTATGLQILTLDLHDINSGDLHFQEINETLAYSYAEVNKIRTLSTTGTTAGNDIDGLLYTPTLPAGVCDQAAQYIPRNATHTYDLPQKVELHLMALAPWIDANCTLAYLQAVRTQNVYAFLFYLPDNGTSIPPAANDAVWSLKDGGRWKRSSYFPVYAIPGMVGQTLMTQLSIYSGNVTGVPNGHELANLYSPSDYIRLAGEVNTERVNRLPSLWVFLLIVLGIVLFIIASTSFSMHWIQRRRRDRLRRRVVTGEVDLEALGIRKLKVPQEVLDQMPIYHYTGPPSKEIESPSLAHIGMVETRNVPSAQQSLASPVSDTFSQSQTSTTQHFLQPTCAICLDDFISNNSMVRELPCRHIFHPECIDPFMRENSSLCPMCKKTVLPKGYCPANITNVMVRREHMVRRLRDRVPAEEQLPQEGSLPRVRDAVRTAVTGGRRVFSAPVRSSSRPVDVELQDTATGMPLSAPRPASAHGTPTATVTGDGRPCAASPEPPPPPEDPNEAENRRDYPRQRASAVIDSQQAVVDNAIQAEDARRSRWRKAVGRVWPGLA
ncbi:hypothetical protein EJ08DRAFT_295542 [Tothia fuscella]|uniref:RING-type domain-containing protein n=1 Tax=Tothia fuscella TaxID=1048955 RepID=A0A9P4P0H8_9PEZI|nr:hypothetical protein EJ08DRAFT_295542 [Tothia fuscella]